MEQVPGAKIEVQRFLKDCKACGMAKGYLHLPGQDRSVRVSCRCDGPSCPRCGRVLMIAPSPIVSDDAGGAGWDAGAVRARCAACGPMFAA
jgi:hypothetical protein